MNDGTIQLLSLELSVKTYQSSYFARPITAPNGRRNEKKLILQDDLWQVNDILLRKDKAPLGHSDKHI